MATDILNEVVLEEKNAGVNRLASLFDGLAVVLAGACGVHCLLTPVLLIALPILGGSLLVHEHFHLWMLIAVVPTTLVAIFLGCRKHKDRWVVGLSGVGLLLLTTAVVLGFSMSGGAVHHECCAHGHGNSQNHYADPGVWITTLGGLALVSAHIRNFRLCRKDHCSH